MPVKFAPTSVTVARGTSKKTIVHQYMKCQSIETLLKAYNDPKTPKQKRKVKNELDRRTKSGLVKIEYVPKAV